MPNNLLSLLIFSPMIIASALMAVPSSNHNVFRWAALIANIFQIIFGIIILTHFSSTATGFQLQENYNWFRIDLGSNGSFAANYQIGLDGMSLPLTLLCIVILTISTLSSWKIKKNVKGYFILLLIMNGAILGAFCSMDMLLFYIFFEFMLIPMYFLIGIWGGERREYAAIKFFLYTLIGSIFILIAMIALFTSVKDHTNQHEIVHTFSIESLTRLKGLIAGSVFDPAYSETFARLTFREWGFLLLFFGFAIKVPVVPFHTWLPDAHVEAPTPISIVLAALLLKIGGYGIIRFACLIFPQEFFSFNLMVAGLGLLSIIYGALNALASKDLKRLIAYSSISHMGFVLLGIASSESSGIEGALYQMVSHGLIAAMLFALVGVLQERTGDRTIGNYSGLFYKMPHYTTFILIAFFASMGIPGFAAFIGEILIFLGAYSSQVVPHWIPVTATVGLILTSAYYLWTIQRMFFGKFYSKVSGNLEDLNKMNWLILTPLGFLIFYFGLYPQPLLDFIGPYAKEWTELVGIKPEMVKP